MKKLTVAFSLLVTAILCFGLVSCDRTPEIPEASTADATTSEEFTTAYDGTRVEDISTEELSETDATVQTTVDRTKKPTTHERNSGVTTAPPTTDPVALRPVITTAPNTTSAPTTTASPVTTTQAPVTTIPVTSQSDTTVTIIDTEDEDMELAVIDLVNKERTAAGLSKLDASPELSKAANIRAEEIAESFGHTRPDGSLWFTVSSLAMGENIASGQRTPQAVMDAWMNSEGHRKNILTNGYTIIGVGCYYDSDTNTYYWVQLFG